MTNLERIENYYDHTLSKAERIAFEIELKSNPALVEEVAFWAQARAAAQEEARARRLEEFNELGKTLSQKPVLSPTYPWVVAASLVAVLIFGAYWWLSRTPSKNEVTLNECMTQYIKDNFIRIPGTMASEIGKDSIQVGVYLYKTGKYAEAQQLFETLLQHDSTNAEAEKLAGIVAFRLENYDQAIKHFHHYATRTNLVSNPGKFYEALALLKRNLPLDNKKAENLLKEVLAGKLEGWKEVECEK